MAKKPLKKMDDMDDMDDMEEGEDEESGELEIEVSISKKRPEKKPVVKKAKGGIIKGFSRIAKPQRFAGTF